MKTSLRPHLAPLDIYVNPVLVTTKRTFTGSKFGGGLASWRQVRDDARMLLGDSSAVAVTTMVDYYGIPSDTPGFATRPAGSRAAVAHLEAEIGTSIGNPRFRPYLMLHEYETLLFVDPGAAADHLANPQLAGAMASAVRTAGEPELVNDGIATAPSKRILAAAPDYAKASDGPIIAAKIGLPALRAACPHFADWLSWLESL